MILLDTDHVSVLRMPDGERRSRLFGTTCNCHGRADRDSRHRRRGNDAWLAICHRQRTTGKTAAIAIVNNALLLTANRRDYEQIPGLRFENWLDEPPHSPDPNKN